MSHSHPPDRARAERPRRTAIRAAFALALTSALGLLGASSALATPTAPPPISILSSTPGFGHGEDFFLTPTGDTSTYANGSEILDTKGNEIWFHPAPAGLADTDFRTQKLWGQNVLTFWEGTENGGVGNGTDYIYNDHYQQIATVKAGNGLSGRRARVLHHALGHGPDHGLPAGAPPTSARSAARPTRQVVNGVVQEIDIKTGKVLWQWDSADHVPYSASEQPLPASASTTWDWFHVNSIHLDGHGGFLVDARNTWATYDVAQSGNVKWMLGGKDSSFTEQAAPGQTLDNVGEIFTWQHDPEYAGQRLLLVLRRRVDDRGARLRLQPSGRRAPRPVEENRDPRGIRQPAPRRPGELAGQRPADRRRPRRVRRRDGATCPTSRPSTGTAT